MKILHIISTTIFFTGLIIKIFHVHYNAILMLFGLAGALISLIIGLLKRNKKESIVLNLVNFSWLVSIFVSVKFLPIQNIALFIAMGLTILSSVYIIRKKKTKMLSTFLVSLLIGLFFFLLPTHKRYNLLSIRWNYEIETDYITWDKYSWFLYQNREFTKAIEASNKAKAIASQAEDQAFIQLIENHKELIEKRTWVKYR